jgi:hypothetical protein
MNDKNKLVWLFLLLFVVYLLLAFLYFRSERRLERLEQELRHAQDMQAEIERKINSTKH